MGVLRRFQQLSSYRDEIETRNQEEIPFSLRIVPRGLLVAEGLSTAYHNDVHLYSDQANPLENPSETRTCKLTLVTQASKPLGLGRSSIFACDDERK